MSRFLWPGMLTGSCPIPVACLTKVVLCVLGFAPAECGLRGGYVEFTNFHPRTVEELYKIASVNLSPNTV